MKTLRTGFSLLIFSCSALTLPIHATGPGAADFEAALLAMSNVDPDAARPAMRKAAAAGHVEAMFQLAGLHAQGYGVEKSDAEAMRWYGAAADKGHPEAAKSLAAMRATGRNKPAIPTSPALPSPARTSPASDQSAPAELYAAAKPLRLVPARHAEARRLFEQAVAAGHVPSMVDLAEMIATGQGGARDADAALALFRRAADSGETPAVLRLSQLYFRPSIGSYANNAWRDPAAGQALLEKLASAGDLEAMVRLAGVLETGTGGVRDVPRSLEIWEKAVAGGHASARAERDRVRDNLNLSPEQKLARYRAALQRAASHRDPSQQRGFALSNYIGSIYGAGLDLEQTAGIVLPIVKEMIETDFHAVYRGRHVASLPWHDIYNRALDADQLRILTQMERFLARHPGVPDPGIAPGQGWSAAYPDGPPPALATVPKPAPVAAATRPSPAQVTKPATQLSEFTRDATTWDEFFTASARDSVSHRYHAADVKLFLEKHPATTEQLRAAYRRARETVRPTPGTVRGREFGAQFVAYHLAILATGLSEQAAAEFVCDDFQTLARSDVQSAHQVLMGVERPHIPLFRPFLTPQQNQQVRDLAQLVVKRQPLPTVPDPSAPVTVTAATVKTVAPAASPAVALETATTGFQTFEEFPGDFRRNLPGHWELSAKISGNARPQTMEVRFTGPQGTVDTVVANPFASSPNRYSARIQEMREARGLWFKVHFNYRDLRFEGQADQRILSGTVYNTAGQQIGTWTALKRRDLDYLDLAEQANRAKNSEAALHYYSAAIRVNGSAENYSRRGSFHYAARNDAAAVADFTAALERDSSQLNARYNRMLAHYNARQHAEALSDADTLLARRTNPLGKEQLALVHQLRGDILWWLERPEDAEKAYATAQSLDPKMAERTRVAKTRDWALAQKIKRDAEVAQIMNRINQGMAESAEALRKANAPTSSPKSGDTAETQRTLAGLVEATIAAVDAKDWVKAINNSGTALILAEKLGSATQVKLIRETRQLLAAEIFSEVQASFKAGDTDQMIVQLEQAASLSHPAAHYMLGLAYAEGEGVAPDLTTARKWLGLAADLGHEQAKTALANPRYAIEPGAAEFAQGDALRQAGDHAAALPLLKQAATKGHTQAAYAVGSAYLDGKGVAPDLAKASDWIELCQENYRKNPNSRNKIMAESAQTALTGAKLRRTMTGAGNAEAAQGVAHHEAGLYAQAFTTFRTAAALGNADGMRGLGFLYFNGQGVKLDFDESRKWLRRALAFDHPQAAADLRALENKAKLYAAGQKESVAALSTPLETITRQDRAEGKTRAPAELLVEAARQAGYNQDTHHFVETYLREAITLGSLDALRVLGSHLIEGRLVKKDAPAGLRLLEQAAAGGDLRAMTGLGLYYRQGKDIPTDLPLAHRWRVRAAEAGDKSSINALVDDFDRGRNGAPMDAREALRWARLAAPDDRTTRDHILPRLEREVATLDRTPGTTTAQLRHEALDRQSRIWVAATIAQAAAEAEAAAFNPAPIHAAIAGRGEFQIVIAPGRAVSQAADQPLEATLPRLRNALEYAEGNPQNLLRELNDLVTRHPDRAEPLIARAQVAASLPNQQELVRSSLDDALKLDPFHPQTHALMARWETATGQRERAFRRMAEMAALRPRSIQIATTEAELLHLLGAAPSARKALRSRIAHLLDDASLTASFAALVASAKLAAGMEDLTAASADLDEALSLNRDPRLLLERAGLRERMKNYAGAGADYVEVLDSPFGRSREQAGPIRERLEKVRQMMDAETKRLREETSQLESGLERVREADSPEARQRMGDRIGASMDFVAGVRAHEAGDIAKARELWTKAAADGHQEAAERLKSLPPR